MSQQETIKDFLRRTAGNAALSILQNLELHLASHRASNPPSTSQIDLIQHLRAFRRKILAARQSEIVERMIKQQNAVILQLLWDKDPAFPVELTEKLVDMFITELAEDEWQRDNGKERLWTKREEAAEAEWRILVWRWEVQIELALEKELSEALGLSLEPLMGHLKFD